MKVHMELRELDHRGGGSEADTAKESSEPSFLI